MEQHDVALIVGSNRRESINAQLARALVALAPAHLRFVPVQIDDLPMYNPDRDPEGEAAVRRLKTDVGRCSGLLVVTPEHNRSIPAVLKNAIDWGSKPMPASVWRDKAVAIAGTSPGAIGTAVGQQHLRQILGVLGGLVLGGEAYVQCKPGFFDASGGITDESTEAFLQAYMERFGDLVRKMARN
ncbi:NADPH-dependent FMN reductase [Ramlibacter montanisoli]|uniref:NAD(P)H-dependent oxidoreductase n=1 Tax=Ramlibacter montanisoli TaxID=2732512 RepID=A0A849K990_9BURK|nr:NADPH-dependent FMN reductase [Ramlibacter montanisoli]NNU42056.1 NAD(P)H-dependent oxidoreductase [Ramlibacter montanisoli]